MNNVSLDFYNNHYFIRVNNQEYYSDNLAKFVDDTNYPFTETIGLLSYEPQRNIYHIEFKDGTIEHGEQQPEIQWFVEHFPVLFSKVQDIAQQKVLLVTLDLKRAQDLYNTEWVVQRHQEQLLREAPTTLTPEQFAALLAYRQELRDLTQHYQREQPAETIPWPQNPIN